MFLKKIKKTGFTLVELIIVITILAVLATIAFISYQNYTASARDSDRLFSLKQISSALEANKTDKGNYPIPDNIYATGNLIGTNIFQVGLVGDNVSRFLKIQKTPLDPTSNTNYLYGLSLDNKYYQVAGTVENIDSYVTQNTYADNENLKAKVLGNYLGVLTFFTGSSKYIANFPSLILSKNGTYSQTGNIFVTNNSKNIPYTLNNSTLSYIPLDSTGILTEMYNKNIVLTGVILTDYSKKDFQALPVAPEELKNLGIDSKLILGQAIYGLSYQETGLDTSIFCPTNPIPEKYFNFDKTTNTIVGLSSSGGTDLIIPCTIGSHKVEHIRDNALSYYYFNSIQIPGTIKDLNAFYLYNYDITGKIINYDGKENTGSFLYRPFKDGIEITSYFGTGVNIVIPDNINGKIVRKIGDYIFYGRKITSLSFGSGLTDIGNYTFLDNKLSTLNLKNVENVGQSAFYSGSLSSLIIGPNIKSLGTDSFGKNKLLTSVTNYDGYVTGSYLYTPNIDGGITLNRYLGTSRNITTPTSINGKNITKIGWGTFNGLTNTLTGLTISEGVNEIGPNLCGLCNLSSLSLPSSLKTIDDNAFFQALITNHLNISNNVTYIGEETVPVLQLPTSLTYLGTLYFTGGTYTIPSSVSGYGPHLIFSSITGTIINSDGYASNQYLYFTKSDGTVEINSYFGTGKNVTIPSTLNGKSVTSIGEEAFNGYGLTSVTLPNTIKSIGTGAFLSNSLTNITIPANVEYIGPQAFDYNSITSATNYDGLTSTGFIYYKQKDSTLNIINYFSSNKTVIIPASFNGVKVGKIEDEVFSNKLITSLEFKGSINEIGNSFNNNKLNLNTITIKCPLPKMHSDAFSMNPDSSNMLITNDITCTP